MPALDRYDPAILDDDDYDDLSQTERRAAEDAMRRRDIEAGITRRDDREIFYDASDEEEVNDFMLHNSLGLYKVYKMLDEKPKFDDSFMYLAKSAINRHLKL